MRKLYRLLQDKLGTLDDFTGEFVPARFNSYREAMRAAKEGERGEFTEEMQAAMIDKMVQAFGTAFGKQAHRHPAMFGEALKEYLGEHGLGRMNEHLGFARVDSEEHERFLDWRDSGHL
jgi:phage gp16-like protein